MGVAAERIKQYVVSVGMAHMFHQPFKDENKLVGVARADFCFVKQIIVATEILEEKLTLAWTSGITIILKTDRTN